MRDNVGMAKNNLDLIYGKEYHKYLDRPPSADPMHLGQDNAGENRILEENKKTVDHALKERSMINACTITKKIEKVGYQAEQDIKSDDTKLPLTTEIP